MFKNVIVLMFLLLTFTACTQNVKVKQRPCKKYIEHCCFADSLDRCKYDENYKNAELE